MLRPGAIRPYKDLPNWKDIEPRLGLSYSLFGNSKTILKWNIGRYVEAMATGIAGAVNPPLATSNTRASRAWNDANSDFIPQANELGALNNTNFGGDSCRHSICRRYSHWLGHTPKELGNLS